MKSAKSFQKIPKFRFKVTGYGIYLPSNLLKSHENYSCISNVIYGIAQKHELICEGNLIYLVGANVGVSITSAQIKV